MNPLSFVACRVLVNPGPIAPNRGHSSFAVLKLDGHEAEVEAIDL